MYYPESVFQMDSGEMKYPCPVCGGQGSKENLPGGPGRLRKVMRTSIMAVWKKLPALLIIEIISICNDQNYFQRCDVKRMSYSMSMESGTEGKL